MIAFISLCYAAFYLLFFDKLKLFEKTARNISVFIGIGIVLIGTIVFMWLTVAPTTTDGRTFQIVVQIVPNVAGPVVEVPVQRLEPMRKGDVLFRIDPVPYQAAVDSLEASIRQAEAEQRLAEIQVDRATGLVARSAGAQQELDTWSARRDEAVARIASLEAQLDSAEWNLEQTEVRAPYDGYVVNLQVRPGVRVVTFPTAAPMTYISDEFYQVVASLSQASSRLVKKGDPVEVFFASRPGQIFTGAVSAVIQATGEAQLAPSGQIPVFTGVPIRGRRVITVKLDDKTLMRELGQGAQSFVAVYTDKGKPFHIITKVVVRMQAWLGYLTNPFG
jgi:multidrug resistance efflux pump